MPSNSRRPHYGSATSSGFRLMGSVFPQSQYCEKWTTSRIWTQFLISLTPTILKNQNGLKWILLLAIRRFSAISGCEQNSATNIQRRFGSCTVIACRRRQIWALTGLKKPERWSKQIGCVKLDCWRQRVLSK